MTFAAEVRAVGHEVSAFVGSEADLGIAAFWNFGLHGKLLQLESVCHVLAVEDQGYGLSLCRVISLGLY